MILPEICNTCDNVYDKYENKKCPYCYRTCSKCGKTYNKNLHQTCPHCNDFRVKSDKPKATDEISYKTKKPVSQSPRVIENVFVKCPKCGRQYNEKIYSKCPTCSRNKHKPTYASKPKSSYKPTYTRCPKCKIFYNKSMHNSCPQCNKSNIEKSNVNKSKIDGPKINNSKVNKPKPIKPTNTVYMSNRIKCSKCGELYNKFKYESCPNCGEINPYIGKSKLIREYKVNSNNDSNWGYIVLAIIIATIIIGALLLAGV